MYFPGRGTGVLNSPRMRRLFHRDDEGIFTHESTLPGEEVEEMKARNRPYSEEGSTAASVAVATPRSAPPERPAGTEQKEPGRKGPVLVYAFPEIGMEGVHEARVEHGKGDATGMVNGYTHADGAASQLLFGACIPESARMQMSGCDPRAQSAAAMSSSSVSHAYQVNGTTRWPSSSQQR